jgi:hypothetical protein
MQQYSKSKWLSIIPIIVILVTSSFHFDLKYPLAATISLVIAIACILLYTFLKRTRTRLVVGLLIGSVFYIIAGSYVFIFAIGVILFELKTKKLRTWVFFTYTTLLLGITIIQPFLLRSYYYLTVKQAYIYPFPDKINPVPDFKIEKILSLDCEWYFNHPEKVVELAKKYKTKNKYFSYYYNLANAYLSQLPDQLMNFNQPGQAALFIPLNKDQNYMTVAFGNEVNYLIGDVNASQHCALLSSTFSPKCQSSRMLRRLIEVNIINGEYSPAEKYITILEKTWFHRKWAIEMRQYLYNEEKCNNAPWIVSKRAQIPITDFIKVNPNDIVGSLTHLIKDHPENKIAVDYLLCLHLLNKDLNSFYNVIIEQIKNQKIGKLPELYQQGLLIYFAKHLDDKNKDMVRFDTNVFDKFIDYTDKFTLGKGNGKLLISYYGKTYWFYYHFAVLKNESKE